MAALLPPVPVQAQARVVDADGRGVPSADARLWGPLGTLSETSTSFLPARAGVLLARARTAGSHVLEVWKEGVGAARVEGLELARGAALLFWFQPSSLP